MAKFMTLTAVCIMLCATSVHADYEATDIGSVHAEGSHGHISTSDAKRELHDLLKGRSDTDIMELRNQLAKSHKKHGHSDAHKGHQKCPAGFGSQRPDGCCASMWADDLTQARYQCQTNTEENGKRTWEVFAGGANSKFTCCPKETTSTDSKDGSHLKEDLDELKRLVSEKERLTKETHHEHQKKTKKMEIDYLKEEDTTEAEMRNQLHLDDRKRSHRKHDNEYTSARELDAMERADQERQMRKLAESSQADKQDYLDNVYAKSTFEGIMTILMNVVMLFFLAVGVVFALDSMGYLQVIGADLNAVDIPGLGVVNLKKMLQNMIPSDKGAPKVVQRFDNVPMQNPTGSTYGSYGSYGSNYGVSDDLPLYQSYKPSVRGEAQALLASKPKAPVKSFAPSPEEDLGL